MPPAGRRDPHTVLRSKFLALTVICYVADLTASVTGPRARAHLGRHLFTVFSHIVECFRTVLSVLEQC